ncbi:MAG: MFS transporter [Actinomycetota bacterium]|nr:MFS transporter [Actinomycetota bacterium]
MRKNAATAYAIYCAGDGFLFRMIFTIYSFFVVLTLGFEPLQLLLLGTILEGTYLLCEIPTGVVADTVSRRLSVVIGLVGSGLAFVLLGFAHSFAIAAVSQVLWGVFASFQSGADVAWLTDEVGEEASRPHYLRGTQISNVAALAGIFVGVALATIDYRLPIIAAGFAIVVFGIGLYFVMPEEGFQPRARTPGEGISAGLVTTFKDGVRQVRAHHVLVLILGTAALHGASTEGFDRLADFHMLKDVGLPAIGGLDRVVWYALIDGVALVVGIAGIAVVKRRTHLNGHAHVARILRWIDIALTGSVVGFGLAGAFWLALLMMWAAFALRSVREPIFDAWVNQGLDPATRATINSMGSQADAIGQAAGGPALGLIGDASVPAALVVSGVLRLPALLLYARAIRRGTVGTVAPVEEAIEIEE